MGQSDTIGIGSNETISNLLTKMSRGALIPSPAFQRRLVWTLKHKLHFIDTVLKGLPFPEIYVANGDVDTEAGTTTQLLVDGQQRMTTLRDYFDGAAELKSKAVKPYKNLERPQKEGFLTYTVVVRDLGSLPMPRIIDVFKRINSTQFSLNETEKLNAVYSGRLKAFCLHLAEDKFFADHKVFSTGDLRRMVDLSFTLTLVISCLSVYFNRDEEHEKYLETYNSKFPKEKELAKQCRMVIDFIEACNFENNGRAYKRVDLLNLFVELHAALFKDKANLRQTGVCGRLKQFYEAVDNLDKAPGRDAIVEEEAQPVGFDPDVAKYLRAASKAQTDKYTRVIRGEIIRAVILGEWPKKHGR